MAGMTTPLRPNPTILVPDTPQSISFNGDKLLRELNKIGKPLSSPFTTPDPIRYDTIDDRPLDFSKGDTDKQIRMRSAYNNMGRASSLARVLSEIAEENNRLYPRKEWNHVQGGNQLVMTNVLNTMHHTMVEGLIDGNLVARFCDPTEPGYANAIKAHHDLIKAPGNYVQAVGRKGMTLVLGNTQDTTAGRLVKDDYPGHWLTPNEILLFHEKSLVYLQDDAYAYDVDVGYQGRPPNATLAWYAGKGPTQGYHWRRYADKPEQRGKLEKFLQMIDVNFVQRIKKMKQADPTDPNLDVPLKWGPLEIGYGKDLRARAQAHDHHPNSNHVYTFMLAMILFLFDPTQEKFQVYRFMVCRVPLAQKTANDDEPFQAANTIDVGITMLACSHWFDGGCNPAFGAGGGVGKAQLNADWRYLQKSHAAMYQQGSLFRVNLGQEKAAFEVWKEREQTMRIATKKLDDQENARKELLAKKDDLEARVKKIKEAQELLKADKDIAKFKPKLGAGESLRSTPEPAQRSILSSPARGSMPPPSALGLTPQPRRSILSSSPAGGSMPPPSASGRRWYQDPGLAPFLSPAPQSTGPARVRGYSQGASQTGTPSPGPFSPAASTMGPPAAPVRVSKASQGSASQTGRSSQGGPSQGGNQP
ncbi:hypothetical protein H2200_012764 [Cladophialophora chaetospira]|uniref:Uncharacterized protein n=1 Tax=Cladophialophora chaetospira TaxID=386627 RepID=A0AA39CBW0_9EURO|nr:hypothetical protein H2200_012764 [Cladophialophora chaetospira]